MTMKRISAICAAVLAVSLTGCGSASRVDPEYISTETVPAVETLPAEEETTEEETTEAAGGSGTVHFLAVGDNLIHTRVYQSAQEHAENGEAYNFYYCYKNVLDKVEAADLAFINQETVICNGEYEVTGSNLNFCSPDELGIQLVDMGFDIVNLSNNHILDKGADGMRACMDFWDERVAEHPGLIVEGVYRDYQDMFDYRTTEVNGVTVGVLGYTDHTNGYSLPASSEMEIPYLHEEELIEKQIKELSEMVDCVVVSAHWGVEDTHVISEDVKSIAKKMIGWGADIIIGTGPHTLQSMEYITRPDGTEGFVYYSLGNFISGQTDNFNMVGGMALFDIVKENGVTTIENPKLTPVITQYETGRLNNVRVYPYYLYTDELIAEHGIPYSPWGTAKGWSRDIVDTIIQNNVPEEYQQLEP
ncbi:MAG: CapA family protein [Oscillospiraceae bacterium]|nr:CapA family protein [Oscillospiraceae bacterium]